jgi:glutathione synthase/RimK-type ligase-like ATP-grasp enzyme
MLFARSILVALKAVGCRVFPDVADSDHFDDKIAQSYLLKALGIAMPKDYPMHCRSAVDEWIRDVGEFPVVAKLRTGSGASNVRLITSADELRHYAKRMFGRGFSGKPDTVFKIKSNVASARSLKDIVKRLKRAPEFFFSLRNARGLPRERGYVYLQEFMPGLDYDLKVVVVGDQLSFIGRSVRAGDFRASGGGGMLYERTLIDQTIIDSAFQAADTLRSDCTGFDMIKDPRNGQPVILEVSYGFSHTALLGSGGHFDREGNWHDTPLNAPRALLDRLVKEVTGQ